MYGLWSLPAATQPGTVPSVLCLCVLCPECGAAHVFLLGLVGLVAGGPAGCCFSSAKSRCPGAMLPLHISCTPNHSSKSTLLQCCLQLARHPHTHLVPAPQT